MGYVRGESLAERLAFEGRLPCDLARRILAELADALDYAHRRGVVHRDIKPANVLVDDESGRVMLADFGVAKSAAAFEGLSVAGLAVGTPQYMSPEQALGSAEVDGRSDIYSLGVLAYVMLTGREPFDGASPQQVAYGHVARAAPSVRDAAPDTPADLAAVVARCLAKDPAERWPDGKCLRSAIGCEESAETATPGELRDIPSFGTLALAWALSWTAIGVSRARSAAEGWVCALLAGSIPLGLLLDVLMIKRPGLRTRDILRVSFWPPMWWGLWWPPSLRRRGDIWGRLPRIARWTRTAITLALVAAPALLFVAHAPLPSSVAAVLARHPWWFAAAEGGLLALLLATTAAVTWWARTRGLSLLETVRLVHGPTIVSASWTASPLSRLLLPPPGPNRHSVPPATPDELLRAVCAALHPPGAAAGAIEQGAASSARRLVAAVRRLDVEIASLARYADGGEVARLEARLAAARQPVERASDDHSAFRDLLLTELDLLRRLRTRHDLAAERRAHLVDLLRRLWALLSDAAGAPLRPSGPDGAPFRERLRAMIAQIDEQAADAVPPDRPQPASASS